MQKILLTLVVLLIIAGSVGFAEASSRLQTIRSATPRAMNAAMKVGDDLSKFFWRNKVAITTGTLLVTAATCPEVFVDGAVAMAAGPPIIVQNYDSSGESKRIRATSWRVFGCLIGVLVLGILYSTGGRARTTAKIVTIILLLGGVLYFSGAAHAGTGLVEAVAARSIWSYLLDLVLILLMLSVPLG